MNRSAVLSECGLYRYRLDRDWRTPMDRELNALSKGAVLFVMLNPSTADAREDDPTIRRCIDFAKRWGHDRLIVCNVFAYRATDPKALGGTYHPVGGENAAHLEAAAREADRIVVAWGASGSKLSRWDSAQLQAVTALRTAGALYSIGAPTKDGHPRHPLYLKADESLQPWPVVGGAIAT